MVSQIGSISFTQFFHLTNLGFSRTPLPTKKKIKNKKINEKFPIIEENQNQITYGEEAGKSNCHQLFKEIPNLYRDREFSKWK